MNMRLGDSPKGRSPLLAIRVTPETLLRLQSLASKQGVTVSEFVRACIEYSIPFMERSAAARSLKRPSKDKKSGK